MKTEPGHAEVKATPGLRVIERLVFIIVAIPAWFVTLPCLAIAILLSILLGLPIAAVKYVFTGQSGIEWYMDNGPLDWIIMHHPLFVWEESISKRRKAEAALMKARGQK